MTLHFEKVTSENRKQIEKLKLFPNQKDYIETVKECLIEADESNIWKTVGIYNDQILIGFAMYGFFQEIQSRGQVWLDRLLIDKDYQGKGYGKKAVIKLLRILEDEYKQNKVYLSVYDINKAAIHLYKKIGFYFNGEYDTKGERVMVYEFK